MSISLHTDVATDFTVKGHAAQNEFAGIYPVVQFEYREGHGGVQTITMYSTREQLLELRDGIANAIRAYDNMKEKESQ